jgi:hypothetical protein
MNTKTIDEILKRYFEGESTLAEEKLLNDFFRQPDIPENLRVHQPLFAYFEQSRSEFMESDVKVVPMHATRNRILYVSSLAAGVLLVIGLFFTFLNDYSRKNQFYRANPDTEIAYHQAEEALMLVSGNLNNGLRQVQKLESLDKALLNLQIFSKFSQYQPIIINPDETTNQSNKSK